MGQPVDLHACQADGAKMLDAVSWMLECYEPWVVIVRLDGQHAGRQVTPLSSSVALLPWRTGPWRTRRPS